MKAARQLLFIVFYLSCSYAVTQERTYHAAGEFQSSANDHVQLNENLSDPGHGFPHFRQAKPKAGPEREFRFTDTDTVPLPPEISHWTLFIQKVSLKSIFSVESVLSRAPPARL